jgi:hypothetical protein
VLVDVLLQTIRFGHVKMEVAVPGLLVKSIFQYILERLRLLLVKMYGLKNSTLEMNSMRKLKHSRLLMSCSFAEQQSPPVTMKAAYRGLKRIEKQLCAKDRHHYEKSIAAAHTSSSPGFIGAARWPGSLTTADPAS